jgi:hypothetical protein
MVILKYSESEWFPYVTYKMLRLGGNARALLVLSPNSMIYYLPCHTFADSCKKFCGLLLIKCLYAGHRDVPGRNLWCPSWLICICVSSPSPPLNVFMQSNHVTSNFHLLLTNKREDITKKKSRHDIPDPGH